jgi:hypothetical protein
MYIIGGDIMSWELVGQGNVSQISNVGSYEQDIPEGSRCQVRLSLRQPVTAAAIQEIKAQMVARNVTDGTVSQSGNTVILGARKGFPWLAVIAAIILAIAILLIIILTWQIFREVIPEAFQGFAGIALIIGFVIIAMSFSRSKK